MNAILVIPDAAGSPFTSSPVHQFTRSQFTRSQFTRSPAHPFTSFPYAPHPGDPHATRGAHDALMATSTLSSLSRDLADLTATGAGVVVQVAGARRPASGVIHGPDTIVTTARAIGREDGLRVRLPDDAIVDADLAGWDPSTGIAVLRARSPLNLAPPAVASDAASTGEIVLALARSWSNVITASAGVVAVVGGPLRTGRRRQLERVIRITAPLHDGFAGGAVFNASGALLGIATAAHIRGYPVVVPASIAWASAAQLLVAGTPG